ncbi:MAG: hypothetical protein ACI9WC_003882 [Arenicella sp.]|jgi:hypothetical protein
MRWRHLFHQAILLVRRDRRSASRVTLVLGFSFAARRVDTLSVNQPISGLIDLDQSPIETINVE